MPIVAVENLSRYYGRACALRGVSFSVEAGECVALCGPNGAGKSTLLSCISGLNAIDEGRIAAQPGIRRSFAAAQSFLYGDLSVSENLRLAARLSLEGDAEQAVAEIAERLGLGEVMSKRARDCSQGTVRRTAVARALVSKPDLLLLDEPFSHLDAAGRELLQRVLAGELQRQATILIATHENFVTAGLASRMLRFERGALMEDLRTR